MRPLDEVFAALALSPFRRRFKLGPADSRYLLSGGLPLILEHAREFVAKRIGPANPQNDGKQTPMRGHPVFVAQHATATCCRGCLSKWHGIPTGAALSVEEQSHVVEALHRWFLSQPPAASSLEVNPADPELPLG